MNGEPTYIENLLTILLLHFQLPSGALYFSENALWSRCLTKSPLPPLAHFLQGMLLKNTYMFDSSFNNTKSNQLGGTLPSLGEYAGKPGESGGGGREGL